MRCSSYYFRTRSFCEARLFLSAVKHATRDYRMHGLHAVILGDTTGVVLACSTGRAGSYPLFCLLQRVAAECLAAGITAHFRWLPSEFNRTDGISRLWEKGGAFVGCKAPRRLPGHALWRFSERGTQVDAQILGVPSLDDLVDDALLMWEWRSRTHR